MKKKEKIKFEAHTAGADLFQPKNWEKNQPESSEILYSSLAQSIKSVFLFLFTTNFFMKSYFEKYNNPELTKVKFYCFPST